MGNARILAAVRNFIPSGLRFGWSARRRRSGAAQAQGPKKQADSDIGETRNYRKRGFRAWHFRVKYQGSYFLLNSFIAVGQYFPPDKCAESQAPAGWRSDRVK